jgi:hypothetical protein
MERLEIIKCTNKRILIDYIEKNSDIKVFEQMDLGLLKNIALNIKFIQRTERTEEKNKK